VKLNYRPEIDGLRAIAVLAVVFYHADFVINLNGDNDYHFLQGGFLGVDIFFVISGYLISSIIFNDLKEKKFSFKNFYLRRARRLLPALFTVIIFSIPFAWIYIMPSEMQNYALSVISSLLFGSNFLFWSENNYFTIESLLKPFLHTWSLALEEQFYLIFPLILFVIWKFFKKKIIIIFLFGFIASLLLAQYLSVTAPEASFYLFPSRAWELLAGVFVAKFEIDYSSKKKLSNKFIPYIGLLLIFISFFTINENTLHPSVFTIIPVAGTAIFIWSSSSSVFLTNILSTKILVGTGLISYSLYLWHFPAFAFARIKNFNLSPFDKFELILISFALAILTYFFIEKPSRTLLLKSKKLFIIIMLSLFIFLITFMTYVFFKKGLPERYPKTIVKMMDFNFDYKEIYQEGTCFITLKNLDKKDPFEKCAFKRNIKNLPLLYLWGDSNAAHLYPGIKEKFSKNYQIIHRSAAVCLPLISSKYLSTADRGCKNIIEKNYNEISELKPDIVFLAGFWHEQNWKLIKDTVSELKRIGIKRIEVVGPVPRWSDPLPKEIIRYYRKYRKIPEYLKNKEHKKFFEIDKGMKKLLGELNVKYQSPIEIFCTNEGCLTRVDDSKNAITAWDESHLTKKGSIYLINNFSE
jgi:peptidoglycan/LPS O-acetylase OafA/YrhL